MEKWKQFLGVAKTSTFSYLYVIRKPDITKKTDTPKAGQLKKKLACKKKIPKNAKALSACKESIRCLSDFVACIASCQPFFWLFCKMRTYNHPLCIDFITSEQLFFQYSIMPEFLLSSCIAL